jgi:prepilin-type N-terminal cleavage/methylation domain-containing protein
MKSGTSPADRGFTLVEAVLVLLLLSLASALVYPNLQPRLARMRREAGLRQLAATLDDLRRQAVTGGKVLALTYDAESGRLLVAEGEREADTEADTEGETEGETEALALPETTTIFSMEPSQLYYFPQGHSSGAFLVVGEEESRSVRVEVGSFTGLARIVRHEAVR